MMKKVLFIGLAVVAFGVTSMTMTNTESTKVESEASSHIKIKIRNNCSHDVKYEYNGLHSTLSKNYYRELTIQPGHTLIIDGEDFMEITASSNGKEYIVCK